MITNFLDTSDPKLWDTITLLQTCLDQMPDPFFAKDLDHQWIAGNQAFAAIFNLPLEELLGKSDADIFPADQVAIFWQGDDLVFNTRQPTAVEENLSHADGTLHTIWTRKFPIYNQAGDVVGLCGFITDITDLRQQREKLALLEQQLHNQVTVNETQASLLDQIAVPVIEVWDGVVLLPLIGSVDSRRAQRIMESMLTAITSSRAHHLILDISGVPVVDTAVAGALIQAVQASKLLGCSCILVGISPEIAQTLVQLGVDFANITTRASLKQGLKEILRGR